MKNFDGDTESRLTPGEIEYQNTSAPQSNKIEFDKLQRCIDYSNQNRYIEAATADNSRKSYRSDIRDLERWGGQLVYNETGTVVPSGDCNQLGS